MKIFNKLWKEFKSNCKDVFWGLVMFNVLATPGYIVACVTDIDPSIAILVSVIATGIVIGISLKVYLILWQRRW